LIGVGHLSFLTPLAALVALVGILPLAASLRVSRRARRIRSTLQLAEPGRIRYATVVAVVALACLVGLAAAQPVLARTREQRVRSDAEVIFVLDISRSMLASTPTGPTRLQRAKAEALRLRLQFPDVPIGIASLTDRTLPHLLPSADEEAFQRTLDQAIEVEQPPPTAYFQTIGTTLAALSSIETRNFFTPSTRHRVIVVFTDGESRRVDASALAATLRRPPAIRSVFVHVWHDDERVYSNGFPETDYSPNPGSGASLQRIASVAGGASFDENRLGAVAGKVRDFLGTGPTVAQDRSRHEVSLAPYLMLLAALPLVLLLVRLSR
jgi:von Willebrand factor type A domain